MSYVKNMSYVNNMGYACRLYELCELCKSYEYFYESLKIVGICFKYNIFCFQVFPKNFHEYIRMENLSYKNLNCFKQKYFLF